MILAGTIVLVLILVLMAGAAAESVRLDIRFRQALLYLPLKLAWRIGDSRIRSAQKSDTPVLYAIAHQSRLDPALMLCLLPENTLHILDEYSAGSWWLEPWRELARTIPFNAGHVFVSRRLVRHLKGNGRLAVYLPDIPESDVKAFRLYRAVARIATKADARIVPISIRGASRLPFALEPSARRRLFPKLDIVALDAVTLPELTERSTRQPATASAALFDRVVEALREEPGEWKKAA